MISTLLGPILDAVRQGLEQRKQERPLEEIESGLKGLPAPRDFASALRNGGFGVIAEIKRASPSKGWLRQDLDTVELARSYVRGGACAISVLTESRFFRGSLGHLAAVRDAVSLPVLRKDFILEPYQVYESRYYGADALLLIAGILAPRVLRRLIELTGQLGMTPLVEVHDEVELRRVLEAGARVIGINNRNLEDFTVDLGTTLRLLPLMPPDVLVVSESGVSTKEQASRLRAAGINGILVGEALVTSDKPEEKIKELLSEETSLSMSFPHKRESRGSMDSCLRRNDGGER